MALFPPVRFELEVVEECESTQTLLLESRGGPRFHGRAVLALRQTAAYGRRGRAWSTGAGNFALSFGLEIPGSPEHLPLLSFLTGIALYDAAREFLPGPAQLRLKWPNDLYLQGRKLSGLISQARQQGAGAEVVVGVGLNLSEAPLAGESIALSALGQGPAPEVFARAFLGRLEQVFREAVDFAWLRKAWEDRARLADSELHVVGEAERLQPLALLPSGELLVRRADGEQRKLASEDVSVRFL